MLICSLYLQNKTLGVENTDYSLYPTKEIQLDYLKTYLAECHVLKKGKPDLFNVIHWVCKDVRIYETEPLPYLIDVFDMLTRAINFYKF